MSKLQQDVLCNVCGSDERHFVSQKGQFAVPISVVICKKCGLTYLSPRWSKEQYEHFYLHEYDNLYRPNSVTQKDASIGTALLKRIKNHITHPESIKRILDVGSGDGANLIAVRKLFDQAKLYAIEPSIKSQQLLNDRNIVLIDSSVDSNWEQDHLNRFDLIIMRHVLEHFLDPYLILTKISKALSENGLLYLAVPNSLKPSVNKPLETKWFRMVHTYYFNKNSLWNLLIKSNLWPYSIIEGDDFHQGEVYLFAKKNQNHHKMNTSPDHFRIQKAVFEKRLRRDSSTEVPSILKRLKLNTLFKNLTD